MRPKAETPSPEPVLLRARARGELSADAAFERFYELYAASVMSWLRLRTERGDADDLFQDVWRIFHGRWRNWQMPAEMEAPAARPVLSFLYRTCHFVLLGHRRSARHTEPVESVEAPDGRRGPEQMSREVQLGQCLALARKICPAKEMDVLTAKLAGVPAREIARTLGMTAAAVDHHFRDAVARLRKQVAAGSKRKGKHRDA